MCWWNAHVDDGHAASGICFDPKSTAGSYENNRTSSSSSTYLPSQKALLLDHEMPYLDAVVKEMLRLRPAVCMCVGGGVVSRCDKNY